MAAESSQEGGFVRRTIIVVAIVALAFLAWQLRSVLVLLFGAVLIATIVRAIADPLTRRLRIPEQLAVLVAVLGIVGLIVGTIWLIGSRVLQQGEALATILPQAARTIDQHLSPLGFGRPAETGLASLKTVGISGTSIAGFLSSGTLVLGSFLIVFFGGIFLAAQPKLYGAGLIKLIPEGRRETVGEALSEAERALRLWLKGQLWAMLLIGGMTWIGLSLLGVQSPIALAMISGLLEFIPYAGAITSSIPAIMVALVQGPETALWTVLLYVVVHHVEAYVIQPLIQQFAVEIPAVLALFALLAFGVLFGFIGILLAAPLAVVSYVLVKRLYVIEALDTPTPIPGEKGAK